jgi:hypothetical protein
MGCLHTLWMSLHLGGHARILVEHLYGAAHLEELTHVAYITTLRRMTWWLRWLLWLLRLFTWFEEIVEDVLTSSFLIVDIIE